MSRFAVILGRYENHSMGRAINPQAVGHDIREAYRIGYEHGQRGRVSLLNPIPAMRKGGPADG